MSGLCRVCELLSVSGAFSAHAVQASGSRGCGHLTAGAPSSSQSAFAFILVHTPFCQRSVVPKLVTANCMGQRVWHAVPLALDPGSVFILCGPMGVSLFLHVFMSSETLPTTFTSSFPHSQTRGAESTWACPDIPCCFVLFKDCTFFVGTSSSLSSLARYDSEAVSFLVLLVVQSLAVFFARSLVVHGCVRR